MASAVPESSVLMVTVPLFHAYGFLFCLKAVAAGESAVIHTERFDAKRALAAVGQLQTASIAGVREHRGTRNIGCLTSGFEAKIVDPVISIALPPGMQGEHWLKGPMVMQGQVPLAFVVRQTHSTLKESRVIEFVSSKVERMGSRTASKDIITLRGSAAIVSEFFGKQTDRSPSSSSCCVRLGRGLDLETRNCSILYNRGIYPEESFTKVKKYGLPMLLTQDEGVKSFISGLTSQLTGKPPDLVF
ncbi:hypothetical protein B296_00055619 [Ensete ventricosum]|uniref:HORMA domain-containing protein n=1 Tax=Ensete ventricosum TaxID=4639 RepID=A0A426XYS3_ENSVE|nr:hypothetical protein B296_00055619 [Ensete ventricosum]